MPPKKENQPTLKLPDKWKDFDAFGQIIPGTNILCAKVPLLTEFFKNEEEGVVQFTPTDLSSQIQEKFGKKLGLVLDLTFTSRYYHPVDICELGADYYKLPVEGTQVPNEGCVQQAMRVIESFNKFIAEGGDPNQYNHEPEVKEEEKKEEEKMEEDKKEEEPKAEEEKPAEPVNEEAKEEEKMETEEKTEEQKAEDDRIKEEEAAKKKEEARKKREEDEYKRFFSRYFKENQPDMSPANMSSLTKAESKKYQKQMKDSEYVVVIHCTHGVNRAGYMACRYMMDRLGMTPTDAINAVSEARGYKLDRESYLNVLNDAETLGYAREQARYTYLIDTGKYWKYTAGTRFTSKAFIAWRKKRAAKRKSEEEAAEAAAEKAAKTEPEAEEAAAPEPEPEAAEA